MTTLRGKSLFPADIKPGLFVLDNIIGALAPGEDIASPVTAQRIVRSLRPISEAGIPTLLVTHTPKGTGEGMSVSSSRSGDGPSLRVPVG